MSLCIYYLFCTNTVYIYNWIWIEFNFTEPITSIIGAPDIYINKGSNLNITCIIKNWPIMDNPQSPSENQQVQWIHGKKVRYKHNFRLVYSLKNSWSLRATRFVEFSSSISRPHENSIQFPKLPRCIIHGSTASENDSIKFHSPILRTQATCRLNLYSIVMKEMLKLIFIRLDAISTRYEANYRLPSAIIASSAHSGSFHAYIRFIICIVRVV